MKGKVQMETEVLSVRKYKAGYEIRTELVKMEGNPDTKMKSAYTPDGLYIGNTIRAHRLIVKRGIKPQLSDPGNNVCSIGFSEKEQKWYGWSHRAIYGFGIGDVAKEGDCCTEPGVVTEYLVEHPEADRSVPVGFEALTLDDAKLMAIAFADSVS